MSLTKMPMLAKKLSDIKPEKLKFPYYAQRKYNGLRCMSEFNTYNIDVGLFATQISGVMLFSKEGNPYIVDHIVSFLLEINDSANYPSIMFDGELYVHGESINRIKSRIPLVLPGGTVTTPSLDPSEVTFIIYDIYDKDNPTMPQKDRTELLYKLYKDESIWCNFDKVILAEHYLVENMDDVYKYRDQFIAEGYEGAMLRSLDGIYVSKRSKDLLKVKKILETECVIVDIVDDGFKSGRETIAFILKNDRNDEIFKCTPGNLDSSWSNDYKRQIYDNKDRYIGKLATVSFYDRSGIKQVPFHANVKTIRDYE